MDTTSAHPTVAAINALLDERGISKSELARRLGWERMQVVRRLAPSKYSTDLTLRELERIAAALEVPVAQLLPIPHPEGAPR